MHDYIPQGDVLTNVKGENHLFTICGEYEGKDRER
jgi:hypothetical protein